MNEAEALLALREESHALAAEASALAPYDALCWVGYPPRAFRAWPDGDAVRRGLAESPIRRALLSHTVGGLHDPEAGNRALAAVLADLPGFAGVMTLTPETQYGDADVDRRIAACLKAGMRAARLLPRSHRYTLKTPGVDALLDALARRGVAVFLPIGQTSWNEVGALAAAHPGLTMLVESAGHHEYLNMRAALPWLESAANIHVPTNRQFLAGGLELLVSRLGPERVVFASGQPVEDPWASLALLVRNRFSDDVRRLIAHGNLERMLDAVKGEEVTE